MDKGQTTMRKTPLWHICGIVSLLVLAHFWVILLDPFKRGWHYPGEAAGFPGAILVAGILSLAASVGGSRYWYVLTSAVVITVLFVMSRMH
jgi:hypothetical protein